MDASQVTNAAIQFVQQLLPLNIQRVSSTASASTQGVQRHHPHHHHKSIADMISNMASGIDDAVKAGKLTNDQAAQMKKELDSIAEILKKDQASSGAELTSEDRQQIRKVLHDVRERLLAALNPQGAGSIASGGIAGYMFKQMDANGDGVVSQNEFATFFGKQATFSTIT